jgi:hypothetical protein
LSAAYNLAESVSAKSDLSIKTNNSILSGRPKDCIAVNAALMLLPENKKHQ